MATIDLDIDGMTCAGCATRVEKALRAVGGVERADVNLALERAEIAGTMRPGDLIDAVERAGYRAWQHDTEDPEVAAARARASDRRAWLWLVVSALLSVPFMVQMLAMAAGLHLMMPYWLEPLLAAPVVFGAGARFHKGAYHAILNRVGTMDLLVSIGTGAAFFYSLVMVLTRGHASEGHLYFEAAAVIVTLVLLGKRMEARAKAGTTEAIRGLMSLTPPMARRLTASGEEETVPLGEIQVGDVLVVRPGDRVPVDGTVLEGRTEVDQAMITGESAPVAKGPGDPVTGGTVNGDGLVKVTAGAVGEDTTLAKIVRLVERAQAGKAPIQKLVDRVSAVFVPVVLGLSALTFVGWLVAGQGVEAALIAAVSVLVIACPCALGLATPTAIVAGTGAAARAGILIKDVDALERAARIDRVLFDKTGTLTMGEPHLTRVQTIAGFDETDALCLAAALQSGSSHPLARAVLSAIKGKSMTLPATSDSRNHPGEGVSADLDGVPHALGNRALLDRLGTVLEESTVAQATEAEAAGQTISYLVRDGAVIAWFAFSDQLREDAASAVQTLKGTDIGVGLLSGDTQAVADRVAGELGIDQVIAGVRPDRKSAEVKALQKQGYRVAMVGDGINDAPALVQADIGIAMGSGADIALDAAAVTLMRPVPGLVPATLDICRRTVAKVRHNLFWAFIYNAIGLPLAALGYLSPALAGAAMAMSSVSVVVSSLMLRRWKP
ncbi:MAG: heavy metal translocating P-type ATPase [Alphaproteobacteria bacterium]